LKLWVFLGGSNLTGISFPLPFNFQLTKFFYQLCQNGHCTRTRATVFQGLQCKISIHQHRQGLRGKGVFYLHTSGVIFSSWFIPDIFWCIVDSSIAYIVWLFSPTSEESNKKAAKRSLYGKSVPFKARLPGEGLCAEYSWGHTVNYNFFYEYKSKLKFFYSPD
jgi:hypothetical protein